LKKLTDNAKDKFKKVDDFMANAFDKKEVDQIEVLAPFRDINNSKLVKNLRDTYGKSIVPLSMVGHFLNHVGNNILNHIYQLFSNQEK
jgi:hypothetical protein